MAGSAATASASTSALEAKIVVLGAAGVGKTSLVMRYCKGSFNPAQTASTIGASFMTKIVRDMDTNTVVRLQIWDTGRSHMDLCTAFILTWHPTLHVAPKQGQS